MAGKVVVSTLNNDTGVLATQNGMTGIPKAWVYFGGQSGGSVIGSFNVSSITRTGTGAYTITFTTAMPNTNYAVAGIPQKNSVNNGMWMVQPFSSTTQNTVGDTKVTTINNANSAEDAGFVSVVVFSS